MVKIILYPLLFLSFFSCSKRKYAPLCPGEKHIVQKYKPISAKKQALISTEINKTKQKPNQSNKDEVFEAYQSQPIPTINNKSFLEKAKTHQAKIIEKYNPESVPKISHKGSLWAFGLFYGSVLFFPAMLVGVVWAIRNLIFLSNKKEQFYNKGFSLVVIINYMVFVPLLAFYIYILAYAFNGGAAYVSTEILFLLGGIGLTFFICLAALIIYIFGDKFRLAK